MEKIRGNKKTVAIFILPALCCYLSIAAFPLLCSTVLSFFNWDVAGLNQFVGLKNYIQLFTTDRIFQKAVIHTFAATILCLVIQIPSAVFLAYLLTRLKRGRNFFKVAFFVPNMISTSAIGILWVFILHPEFGLVNAILRVLGLEQFTHVWLGESDTALICVILAASWQYIGYHMIIYLCAMQNISASVLESARIDGATSWQAFRKITFPLIAPILKIDTVLVATGSLRIFDMVFVMTGGGPNHASEVIASHMYTRSFKGMQFGYGSAMAVILMILCIAVTVFLNAVFKHAEEKIE